MSIVLVCFSNAPKVSDEAVKRDSELDEHLESRVEGKVFFFVVVVFCSSERKKENSPLSDDSFKIFSVEAFILKCSSKINSHLPKICYLRPVINVRKMGFLPP